MNFQVLRISNIIQFIKRAITPESPILLGRWEIKYCKSTINKRVDLANEDHCGICYSTKYHNQKHISPDNNIIKKNKIIELE